MNISSKKLAVFDLDGTLAPSKSIILPGMATDLARLLGHMKVAIISGGAYQQFQTELLSSLPTGDENYSNFYLLPTSGTRLFAWRGSWTEQYAENLTPQDKARIMNALNGALLYSKYEKPQKTYGALIEDRGSQISFSGLGQQAPIEAKNLWDPTREKREKMLEFLQKNLPEFDCRMGGMTTIDITHRGVNKAYGIRKLEEFLNLSSDEIVFIGDALFHGGNDYPARATGVDCVQVKGPEETQTLVEDWVTTLETSTPTAKNTDDTPTTTSVPTPGTATSLQNPQKKEGVWTHILSNDHRVRGGFR